MTILDTHNKGVEEDRWTKCPSILEIGRREYGNIHQWLRYNYGSATFCENTKCNKKSKIFTWAKKIDCKYERKRKNFIQLCRSCHAKMDLTDDGRKRISESNLRKILFKGKEKTFKGWAKEIGLSEHALKGRIYNKKQTIRQALSTPPQRNKLINFNRESKTLREWSETLGIKYMTLLNRLGQRGWSVKKHLLQKLFGNQIYELLKRWWSGQIKKIALIFQTDIITVSPTSPTTFKPKLTI